ncbi:protein-glutamine glutaminase family protein [Streptomyces sp. NPDC090025]|uniref:protein-glutamine glutaminase family protein n=1 Tax=Streptomyces sp. NPDC090025 TaxID=3365922 RepID=UPI0038379D61
MTGPITGSGAEPTGLLALQRSAGNAAVTAVIQRMEAAGDKRKRENSPGREGEEKRLAATSSSSESEESASEESASSDSESEESEAEEYSSEEELVEPFPPENVGWLREQQSKTVRLLERMDEQGADESVVELAESKHRILTLLVGLAPMRSAESLREAIRLVGAEPDGKVKTSYLARLKDQLDYLAEAFPDAGPPTTETVEALWPRLQQAFANVTGEVGQDGCEYRAHAICLAIADADPTLASHHLAKQWATPPGGRLHAEHQWNHHVAASVTTTDGVLVIDPIFSRTGPLTLSRWAELVQVDPDESVHQVGWGFLGKPNEDGSPEMGSALEYVPRD